MAIPSIRFQPPMVRPPPEAGINRADYFFRRGEFDGLAATVEEIPSRQPECHSLGEKFVAQVAI
jgi:hypothetical protein